MGKDVNVCNFCGQLTIAPEVCRCPGAEKERKTIKRIEKAKEQIDKLFGDGCIALGYVPISIPNIEMLKFTAERIARGMLHKASYHLSTGTKASISAGSDGALKIERTETQKNSSKVDE